MVILASHAYWPEVLIHFLSSVSFQPHTCPSVLPDCEPGPPLVSLLLPHHTLKVS